MSNIVKAGIFLYIRKSDKKLCFAFEPKDGRNDLIFCDAKVAYMSVDNAERLRDLGWNVENASDMIKNFSFECSDYEVLP